MVEFKFSCPGCGQRIQATDAHSGMQISCPACEKAIVVPYPAGVKPAVTAAAPPPPSQPTPAYPAAPVPLQRPNFPGKKSKTIWIAIGCVTGLVAIGATVFLMLPGSKDSDKSMASIGKKVIKKAAPKDPKGLSVTDILNRAVDQCSSMTNYSATGTTVVLLDMSVVDVEKMTGLPAGSKESKELKNAMSKPIKTETEFSMKLGRTSLYLVEWETKTTAAASQPNTTGAVWSTGEGDFISATKGKYTKMKDRQQALAFSQSFAGTMPLIFFNSENSPLKALQGSTLCEDETVDGQNCYVLNGKLGEMQAILWISKDSFLLKQSQQILGDGSTALTKVSDADIDKGLNKMGDTLTAQQKAQAKEATKKMQPMLEKMKGSITETYSHIEINQPVKKEDFQYELPPEAKLSTTLY